MKFIKISFISTLFFAMFQFGVASAEITGSDHDFSTQGWSGNRICIVCHTPHNANMTPNAPLWNHEQTSATFSLYASNTLDATLGQPVGNSLLCLSCHDGTIALDSFSGQVGTNFISGGALVGTNLTNDHPISFTYDSALAITDGELTNPSADGDTNSDTVGLTAPFLPLFGGQLQCASCHDVHNIQSVGNPKLLIETPNNSQLCLKCHQK